MSEVNQEGYLLCGLPGSGKTSYTTELMARRPLVRLSIDEAMFERYGRYGIDYPHMQYKELEKGVYEELDEHLANLLRSGESVVLDYGLWLKQERDKYRRILGSFGVRSHLLYFKQDRETLSKRLLIRNQMSDPNALPVDEVLFERMHAKFEEPNGEDEIIIS